VGVCACAPGVCAWARVCARGRLGAGVRMCVCVRPGARVCVRGRALDNIRARPPPRSGVDGVGSYIPLPRPIF
jgi:hypothetical protein